MMGFDINCLHAVSAGLFVVAGLTNVIAALRAAPPVRPVNETLLRQAYSKIDRSRLSSVLSDREPKS